MVDLDDYFEGRNTPIQFKTMATTRWESWLQSIFLSDPLAGALHYNLNGSSVLVCLNWRTGAAESILLDRGSDQRLQRTDHYASDVRVSEHHTCRRAIR